MNSDLQLLTAAISTWIEVPGQVTLHKINLPVTQWHCSSCHLFDTFLIFDYNEKCVFSKRAKVILFFAFLVLET